MSEQMIVRLAEAQIERKRVQRLLEEVKDWMKAKEDHQWVEDWSRRQLRYASEQTILGQIELHVHRYPDCPDCTLSEGLDK
jgi:hypothetical protein